MNLIFLAIFLGLSLPGAVILFKSKLDPGAAPMYLPDPVRQRLPYMAPQWTPDEVTRVIPPLTGQWVEQLNREQAAGAEVLMRQRHPVVSDDRMLQVTAIKNAPPTLTVYLIAWDSFGVEASHYDASLSAAGHTQAGRVRAARKIPMPETVRRELLNAGYVKPRPWIAWLELEFDAPPPAQQPLVLQVSCKDGTTSATSSVNLFTQ